MVSSGDCLQRFSETWVSEIASLRVMSSRYRTAPEVKFAEFRVLEQRRIDASNAIWAILAGSKMAANSLNLDEGSDRTLAEMFPKVDHIERFNLRSDIARALLSDAETDLCMMGMSYAIALHEDFVKTCLGWLVPLGLITEARVRNSRTVDVHENVEVATGVSMEADSLALFHLTRHMRNCHIHAGGQASSQLQRYASALTTTQLALWEELTKQSFVPPREGDLVGIGVGGLIATLAIGKRMSYEVNLALQAAIPRDQWADMAAGEYFSSSGKSPRDPTAVRSVSGHVRETYRAISLTAAELQAAVDRLK